MVRFLKQKDKQKHILISALLTILSLQLISNYILAIGIVVVIGMSKELIHDWLLGKGHPEFKDMLANSIGISIGVIAHYAICI